MWCALWIIIQCPTEFDRAVPWDHLFPFSLSSTQIVVRVGSHTLLRLIPGTLCAPPYASTIYTSMASADWARCGRDRIRVCLCIHNHHHIIQNHRNGEFPFRFMRLPPGCCALPCPCTVMIENQLSLGCASVISPITNYPNQSLSFAAAAAVAAYFRQKHLSKYSFTYICHKWYTFLVRHRSKGYGGCDAGLGSGRHAPLWVR